MYVLMFLISESALYFIRVNSSVRPKSSLHVQYIVANITARALAVDSVIKMTATVGNGNLTFIVVYLTICNFQHVSHCYFSKIIIFLYCLTSFCADIVAEAPIRQALTPGCPGTQLAVYCAWQRALPANHWASIDAKRIFYRRGICRHQYVKRVNLLNTCVWSDRHTDICLMLAKQQCMIEISNK